MGGYDIVVAARKSDRRCCVDYISEIFTDFCEIHGDRRFGDDPALVGGLAFLNGIPVTVLGTEKGKDIDSRIRHNFGEANPEGYRKSLRLMKQAEKFHRPVICLVDTAGAFCGMEAEQRGQGEAIAENLYEMSAMKTPIISVMIGEGGSGGAIALAFADKVFMLENAYYSVVSPEACASILWKDKTHAKEAAEALKLTSADLQKYGIIDEVVPETDDLTSVLKQKLTEEVEILSKLREDELLAKRYEKYRRIGG